MPPPEGEAGLAQVPVLFLTARAGIERTRRGLALGAVGFIHKPISPPIVAARIRAQLEVRAWQDFLHDRNDWLQAQESQRLAEIHHCRTPPST
ncbi:two-component system response regulator [Duganella sp. BJB1802]|uniref:response regulator n=1 Tax=Duganella sp. BJB1802 TaxID=2744575 RepID=UPI0026574F38|nr:hypothetical protein [Duganella sp. BJB1802]